MSVRNGPNEGTWSVFAAKVVEERDALLEHCVYYRNLAIALGAKPEQMRSEGDRALAREGLNLTEKTPGYWSLSDSIEELDGVWHLVDEAKAPLKPALEAIEAAIVELKCHHSGDGDRHWCPRCDEFVDRGGEVTTKLVRVAETLSRAVLKGSNR